MDKETLSHYGWIVILVLILSVLLALATPFGNFIADGFKVAYNGLIDVTCKVLDIERPNIDSTPQTDGYAVFDNGDGTTTTLTWFELMLEENGEEYDYDAELVYDITIGEGAFSYCDYLLSVKFPSSIVNICTDAFSGCDSLTTVDFSGCTNLKVISYDAFYNCDSLTTVDLSGCTSLMALGTSLDTDADGPFCSCTYLTTVDLSGCTNLRVIGNETFADCTSLTTVDLSGCTNLTILRVDIFDGCDLLETLDFSVCPNLKIIAENTFSCENLKSITLPASITYIDEDAFEDCESLKTIKFNGTMAQWDAINFGEDWDEDFAPYNLICTDGYRHDGECWGGTATCIQKAICEICNQEYGTLGYHTISNGQCTTCGNQFDGYAVFVDGRSLSWEELMLPENGEKYDYNAEVITDAIVGEKAFRYNETLLSIVFPSTITKIDNYAFDDCVGLTKADFSSCTNLTTIGGSVFDNCKSLTTVDFNGCTNLTTIGGSAFYNCKSLTTVDLSGCTNLTTIGGSAFSCCDSLTTVDLSGCTSLSTIDNNTFNSCESLTTVDLSGCTNLTTIGGGAFNYCDSLTTIVYGKTVAEWHNMDIPTNWLNNTTTKIICTDGFIGDGGNACIKHTGGTATCQEKATCTVCGYKYGVTANCSGGTATCQQKAICKWCNQEYGSLASHNGGTATCTQKAICKWCNQEYGSLVPHNVSDGNCTVCGVVGTVIESAHNPHQNTDYDLLWLGSWNYTGAKSVTITITSQTYADIYDYACLYSNNKYINASGQLSSSLYKFGGSKTTRTFTTTALTGSVYFKGSPAGNYYGVKVVITPNY